MEPQFLKALPGVLMVLLVIIFGIILIIINIMIIYRSADIRRNKF